MTGKDLRNISVIGAGAWGTALADVVSRTGHNVLLYAREADLAAKINKHHENDKYLRGIRISDKIRATFNLAESLLGCDLVILATPAQYLRETLIRMLPFMSAGVPLLNTAKGIEMATGKLLSEMAAEVAPSHPFAILSGPTFAHEAARGLPTAITLAMADLAPAAAIAENIRSPSFRPYLSDDVVGAEIAGALKNVIAIACGIVEGRQLGQNARSAVMTRGMAEIRRYGMAKGAKSETFLGLAGLGDLTLTCHSMASRNFSLGYELGSGKPLADILAGRVSVAEGVATARAIAGAARKENIDMPISTAVAHILDDHASIDDIIAGLLSRHLKTESE